jgi:hypothetical protein
MPFAAVPDEFMLVIQLELELQSRPTVQVAAEFIAHICGGRGKYPDKCRTSWSRSESERGSMEPNSPPPAD